MIPKLIRNRASAEVERAKSLGIDTASDNVCGANLSDSESRGSRACDQCGRRFVPVGPKRFCSHACYAASLRQPIETRFWTKINRNGPPPAHLPHLGPCWLFTGNARLRGYGSVSGRKNGKPWPLYAHRVAWELTNGPIPAGACVLHKCDVPICCRPDHLFLGSQADNLADAREKGRLDETLPRNGRLTFADRLAIYHAPRHRGANLELARRYGITKAAVAHIRKGRFAGCPKPLGSNVQEPLRPFELPDSPFELVRHVELVIAGEVR